MAEEDIIKELDELSQIVEGGEGEEIGKELKTIEEIASVPEEKEEKPPEEKMEKEKVEEEKAEREKEEIKPEKMIKGEFHFYRFASALLILIGVIVYALAFYLRWEGWRLIRYPPSAAVAILGTLLILGGGEIYYRGKMKE